MLTLSLIKSAKGAADYYAKEDNYYLSEIDAKNMSLWWGKGASELGLNGKKIEKQVLQDLFEGDLPNGVTVGSAQKNGKKNHRPGYDLCFHAPKSVSILALDGRDKRFYDAHLEAVKETLKIIERDCAQVKIFEDGQPRFKNTRNLTVALVRHTASRERDPHLHHHALIMNITQKQDKNWRALASNRSGGLRSRNNESINGFSERVYKNQIYYGLIYQSTLANKVIGMGCEIENVGRHGLWEIKGVPEEARRTVSKRRKQIEEAVEKLNYRSLKATDMAALYIRKKKDKDIKLEEIQQTWKNELASVGFSSEKFLAELDKKFEFEKEQGGNKEKESVNIEKDKENAKEAVKDAIEYLSQYNLKLDYAKIATKALELSIGHAAHRDIIKFLNEDIKNGELVSIDKSDSIFVTEKLTKTENEIRGFVDRGKNTNNTINLKTEVKALDSINNANDVGEAVLKSKDRLGLVEMRNTINASSHLSSSTKFVTTVLDYAETSGKTVRILSPNRMMANEVNENIRRRPNNLWGWLLSLGKPELGETVAGFKYRYKMETDNILWRFRKGKDVVVVNDIGSLGCNDLYSLLELTEKTNAKVIFLRDLSSAKKGFSPGNSTEILKQAGIETFTIGTSDKVAEKGVKNNVGEKEEKAYISELKEVKDDNERISQLAKDYVLREDEESKQHTVVLLGSKRQLKSTNEAIRNELKNQGKISDVGQSVSVLTPVYMSNPEITLAHKYQKNMIIRFYDTRYMGRDWKVESIDREKNILRLVQDGKENKDTEKKERGKNKGITSKLVRKITGRKRILWNPKKQKINHGVYKNINHAVFKRETIQIAKGDKLIATSNMRFLGIKNATKFIVQDINEKHVKLVKPLSVIRETDAVKEIEGIIRTERLGGSERTSEAKEVKKRKETKKEEAIKIRLSHIKNSHFQYDYATTIGRYSGKKTDHILADMKAYSLDKGIVDELTRYAQKSLTIFTDDANVAQRRFSHIPVKLTVAETLLYASKRVGIKDDVKDGLNVEDNIKNNTKDSVQDISKDIISIERYINNRTASEIKSDIEKAISVLRDQYDIRNRAENRAVEFALEKITSRNAGFIHKDLVKEALEYALTGEIAVHNKKVTREDIEGVIKDKRDSGELIMGCYFDDGTRWTTKKIREQELLIVEGVKKGKDKLNPLIERETVERLLEIRPDKPDKDEKNERSGRSERSEKNKNSENLEETKGTEKTEKVRLTQDQKNACHLITTAKDQFVIVQGDTSTGKTTMLGYVQKMLRTVEKENWGNERGKENKESEAKKEAVEILALAPTHQATKELKSKGLKAQTFKSFLVEWNRNIKKDTELKDIKLKKTKLDNNVAIRSDNANNADKNKPDVVSLNSLDNKLIVLDESSMASNEDFLQFLEIVINTKSHIVLSGDFKQHLPIGCGKIFELLIKLGVLQVVYLRENVRQKNPILKAAVKDTINKSFDSALEKIASIDPQEHIKRIDTELLNEKLDKNLHEELNKENERNKENKKLEESYEKEAYYEGSTKGIKKAEEIEVIDGDNLHKQRQQQEKINLSINPLSIEFFNSSRCSVIERDDNNLKDGESSLKEMVAEDFLTRAPETRDNTVVIVHAHDDRKYINEYIRKGLKEQGYIAKEGIRVDRLASKGLTDAEHRFTQSYKVGDVVKLGKRYYHVTESDTLSRSVLLKSESGKTKYFYPEKYSGRYNPELYKRTTEELAVGDSIRLTKTDKERGLYTGFKYVVKRIDDNSIIFENKERGIDDIWNNHQKSQEEQKIQETQEAQQGQKAQLIVLNTKELRDVHWDYSYTVTGYSVQGASEKYAIDLEVSYRENLANQRSFYVGSSRAMEHLTVYTDSIDRFLNQLFKNTGDKYAALEVTGELDEIKSKHNASHRFGRRDNDIGVGNIKYPKKQTGVKYQHDFYSTKKNTKHIKRYDAKEIGRLLSDRIEPLIEGLLGRSNQRLSSSAEWRYGNKGSLIVTVEGEKKGLWYNFETGESGNLLALLQRETGLSFRESLKYAANWLGMGEMDSLNKDLKKPVNTSDKDKNNKNKVYDKNKKSKTREYAQKLASESMPVTGTIAEKYLKEVRGIKNIDSTDIRYHPGVYVGKNIGIKGRKNMPAMIAVGRDENGNIKCVQATYLDPKTANKAELDVKKRTYSSPSGASVFLQENKDNLDVDSSNNNNNSNRISFITEGIETGLSVKDAVRDGKNSDVIATLGKSNFANINPQSIGQKVVFCLDNDSAESSIDNTIQKAAERLIGFGKEVFVAVPDQIGNKKTDFNDVARAEGFAKTRDYLEKSIPYHDWKMAFEKAGRNYDNRELDKEINKIKIDKKLIEAATQAAKIAEKEIAENNRLYDSVTRSLKIENLDLDKAAKSINSDQKLSLDLAAYRKETSLTQKNIDNNDIDSGKNINTQTIKDIQESLAKDEI